MTKTIYDTLREKKDQILLDWQSVVSKRYNTMPLAGMTEEAILHHPAEYVLAVFTKGFVDCLLDREKLSLDQTRLEDFCKVRVVQDLRPAEALAFIFDIKKVIYANFGKSSLSAEELPGIREIEQKVDSLALEIFSGYVEQKVRITQIRNNELNRLNWRDRQ
jgi:hypothetical protein